MTDADLSSPTTADDSLRALAAAAVAFLGDALGIRVAVVRSPAGLWSVRKDAPVDGLRVELQMFLGDHPESALLLGRVRWAVTQILREVARQQPKPAT